VWFRRAIDPFTPFHTSAIEACLLSSSQTGRRKQYVHARGYLRQRSRVARPRCSHHQHGGPVNKASINLRDIGAPRAGDSAAIGQIDGKR
jgi:hypothetical protein